MRRGGLAVLSILVVALVCLAQKPFEYWPGANYDPKIPTMRQALGFEAGERVSSHAEIVHYFETLAAASPGRMKVFEYGASWEGRKLIYAAIGSEANLRRLAEIRASVARLADPRKTSAEEARRIIETMPAIVWLSYGVHGNEISSPDAAMLTAYHLLAARNDKMTDEILAHTLVLIDPLQNPDGRDRFVHYFDQTRGAEPDASPIAAEHNEVWPGGRTNHYLFDLNRDWLALTQPEIRDEVKVLREWYPLVCVDLHEMNADTTYFFSPESDPYNPNLTTGQREGLKLFGHNNAKWFDHFGFDYFTRELYDAFYPGYGASWPSYYGALAMTYEQASTRGLVVRRSDDTLLRFRDTLQHHFVASLSTLEAAAANREKLLQDFYQYRATAIEEGSKEAVRAYILPRGRDAAATDKLAGILTEHGIEVQRARAAFRAGDREYAAGTYVASMAQPSKRLIRTLLDPDTPMDDKFVAAEETRRQRRQRSEIYDVTAWSLPLLFNVEAVASPVNPVGDFEPVAPALVRPGTMHGAQATVAYLAPWDSAASGRLLAAALRRDLKVHSSDKPFAQNGAQFPAGSLIFKVKDNPPDLGERLAELARETGADIWATNSGWVDEGVNFGSRYVMPVRKPDIAIAWDQPVAASSAGAVRFVLERQFGYPITLVRTAQLDSPELEHFQVLILPEGSRYQQILGEDGVERLKNWVDAGGTLVALGSAVGFAAEGGAGLLDIAQENAFGEGAKEAGKSEKAERPEKGRVPGAEIGSEEELRKLVRAGEALPDRAPGAIVRARVRPEHWLTAGVPETVTCMIEGRAIFTPIQESKGVNAVYFEAADKLVASGYLWSENRKQMAFKPLVVVETQGRGVVIGFTADPTFRAMEDGLNMLLLNAVFRGPAHVQSGALE